MYQISSIKEKKILSVPPGDFYYLCNMFGQHNLLFWDNINCFLYKLVYVTFALSKISRMG